jgi:ferredoxin
MGGGMIRVMQLQEKCIGCNACVEVDRFRWRISKNNGKCVLIDGVEKKGWFTTLVGEDELETLQRAKNHCPVNIIKFEVVK